MSSKVTALIATVTFAFTLSAHAGTTSVDIDVKGETRACCPKDKDGEKKECCKKAEKKGRDCCQKKGDK